MTKSQELKEKIIKENLPNLSVDPLGSYVNSEELVKYTYKSYEDYYYNCLPAVEIDPEDILSEQDHQEICRAMIDDIKNNVDE